MPQSTTRVGQILAAIRALSAEERATLLTHLRDEQNPPPASQPTLPLPCAADTLDGPADYALIFDGGSSGNPGTGYGSYAVLRAGTASPKLVRLDLRREMTNNEAEYETLVAGLQGLIERIEAARRPVDASSVKVRGDSALVINQVEGTWKTNDDRMHALRIRCRTLLGRFKAHRLVLQPREESVRVLGH